MDKGIIKWIKSIAKQLEEYSGVAHCDYNSYDEDKEVGYMDLMDDYGNEYTLPITPYGNQWVILINDGEQMDIERLHEWLFHQSASCLGA